MTIDEAKTQVEYLAKRLNDDIEGLRGNEDRTAEPGLRNAYKMSREYLERLVPIVKEIQDSLA